MNCPINIGTGREASVLDLIAALTEVGPDGVALDPEFAAERRGEVRHSWLDPSRARRELVWGDEVELREGLKRILARL
jgi:UDP-glucose 4-epimerase